MIGLHPPEFHAVSTSTTEAPSATQIEDARIAAGLSKAEAAALVYATDRAWRYWESGVNKMPVSLWELFQIKVAQRAEAAE